MNKRSKASIPHITWCSQRNPYLRTLPLRVKKNWDTLGYVVSRFNCKLVNPECDLKRAQRALCACALSTTQGFLPLLVNFYEMYSPSGYVIK